MSTSRNLSLINHLEESFSKLPNPHTISLTALTSIPKRTTSLYPYTTHHPRCFQIDYLVTLACEVDRPHGHGDKDGVTGQNGHIESSGDTEGKHSPEVLRSTTGHVQGDISQDTNGDSNQGSTSRQEDTRGSATAPAPTPMPTPRAKARVMTTALSAHLYILPQHRTSILYISKLDSSGFPTTPLSLTRTFITSILTYFLLPASRPTPYVRIQLFARSQGQYLFPNSAQGPKKVLGGLGLCGWWKGVYEDVAASVKEGHVKLGMVLPGYSAEEARGMLGQRKPLAEGLEWTSDPPFTTPLPAPSGGSSSSSSLGPSSSFSDIDTNTPNKQSLASLIPSLPDDPKARFLDDLVSEGAEDPQRRRQLLKAKPDQGQGGSSSASIQSSGTGSPGKKKDPLRIKVKAEDEAERRFTNATLERVSVGEYWERMGFRQECISGDVTGFFTLEFSPPIPTTGSISSTSMSSIVSDPKSSGGALPPGIVDRILQALLNTDFKSLPIAIDSSALWEKSVKSLIVDEIGEKGYLICEGMVVGKEGEVVLERKRKEEAVITMLQPRKKKKV